MPSGEFSIVIAAYCRLGDTLCMLPALWAIRARYPEAHICMVSETHGRQTFVTAEEVLGGTGLVDQFETLLIGCGALRRWSHRLGLILRMRRRTWRYGVALVPPHPPATKDIFGALRRYLGYFDCEEIVGPGEPLVFSRSTTGKLSPLPWVSDSLLEIVGQIGVSVPASGDGRFELPLRKLEAEWAAAELRAQLGSAQPPLAAVSIGANMPANHWPLDRYRAVLESIHRQHGIVPVLFGTAGMRSQLDEVSAGLSQRVVICGESIARVAELTRCCDFYLGNDTGLMHLAAATGLPCVMISGARNAPRMWEPYGRGHIVLRADVECEGCLLHTCVEHQNACLKAISVEQVCAAVSELVARGL